MQLFLHIGGPKTGTTSFQAALTAKGALENTGFWTPMVGQVPTGAHHYLIRNLIGINDQKLAWKDPVDVLRRQVNCHTGAAIISSEFCDRLATNYPHVFSRLLERLRQVFDHITIVRVWRDMSTLSSSRYQQSLCNFNHYNSFETTLENDLDMQGRQLANMLSGYDAIDDFRFVAYRDHDRGFNSVEAVSKAIGVTLNVSETGGDAKPALNVGRSLAQVAATKWLLDETGIAPRSIATLHRRRMHDFIRDGIIARGGDRNRFQGVTPPLMALIRARNLVMREKLANQHWGQSWQEATNAGPEGTVKDLSPAHLPADSAAIARDVVEELKTKLPEILATPLGRPDHSMNRESFEARLDEMDARATQPTAHSRPASRKLILHVGGHKTGSTSFQALLTPGQPYLEQSDLWTTDIGQGRDGAHHHLIYRLVGATSPIDGTDALRALRPLAAMEARTCLISSEFVHHLMIFQPSLFRQLLRSLGTVFDDISVVQVIRETGSLINSRYQQTLCKFAQNDAFEDYARNYLEFERRLLSRTLNGFGINAKITSLPYQPHLNDFDAIALVANAVGLPYPETPLRKNTGRSLAQMAVSRQMMADGTVPHTTMAHSQRHRLHNLVAEACVADQNGVRFQGFDDALLAEAHNQNRALRDRFAKTAWNAKWGEVFDTTLPAFQPLNSHHLPDECRETVKAATAQVASQLEAILADGPNLARHAWNMSLNGQFTELARLNRAARAAETTTETQTESQG